MRKIVFAANYVMAWGFLILDIIRDVPGFLTVTSVAVVVISTLVAWAGPPKAADTCPCGRHSRVGAVAKATADDVR